MSFKPQSSTPSRRILVVGPAWVGDMVLAQSLFKVLKRLYPGARLDVLAPPWTEPLLARMPEVDRALPISTGHGELRLRDRLAAGRRLRAERYDRAIVLPGSFKSALIPFFAGARRRTGYRGEWRYGLLNDIRPLDARRLPRTVDRFVNLALELGERLSFALPAPELVARREDAAAALARLGRAPPAGPVLALCPGAEYGPAKRWPREYFVEIARAYLAQGWEVWLFGSGKDAEVTAAIDRETEGGCLDLGGRTTLGEAIDLLSLAAAVVANDSGLMHIAAALNRRLVAIFGSTDPRHTPPMNDRASVLYLGIECSPCFERECRYGHYRCLRDIIPARVRAAIDVDAAAPDQ